MDENSLPYNRLALRLKIGTGVVVFIIALLSIAVAFLISVGILFHIIVDSAFYLSLLLGPLLFLGLLFLLIMLFSNGKWKWTTLSLGIILLAAGVFDLAMKSLSREKSIPLIQLVSHASNQSSTPTISEFTAPKEVSVTYDNEEAYFNISDTLGYVPAKKVTRSSETADGEILFEVDYTIDSLGLRVAPPFEQSKNSRSILFFGGSVTFGYGLHDKETLPYQLGMISGNKYKVFNFAFNGYGTHQMVAALETGFVEARVDVTPEHIFYIATPLHMDWIRNRKNWGRHDPVYAMDESQQPVYAGRFDELPSEIVKSFWFDCGSSYEKLKLRSYTLQLLSPIPNGYYRKYTDSDQELFIALIKQAEKLAAIKYPQAKFHVIYWDGALADEHGLMLQLENSHLDYYLISDILKDLKSNPTSYAIAYPTDPHPNRYANGLIAEYILKKIIGKNEDYL